MTKLCYIMLRLGYILIPCHRNITPKYLMTQYKKSSAQLKIGFSIVLIARGLR